MKGNRGVLFALVLFLGLSSLALANGFNLNSLGSRALAMGGAFVGLADDYSAIYWNPAGIAQFKTKHFGFYGTDIIPKGSYLFQRPTEAGLLTVVDAKTKTKHYLSGMVAYYHPINEKLVAGFGIYVPSGLGATWNGDDFRLLTNNTSYLWESRVGMITFAPAVSYKINDMVSVGATLNINYGMFTIKTHAGNVDIPVAPGELDLGQYDESLNGWGLGATFGVLVKPNDTLSFGATVRTPSKIKLNGDVTIQNIDLLSPNFKNTSEADRDVTWPWWVAAGVAYRPRQDLILTADLQWTQWSREKNLETRYKDPYWSLFMEASGGNIFPLKWGDALQIRFGAEYMLYQNIALRAGYYYDPSPAPDMTLNVLLPTYDFNGITLGLGYDLNGLAIDFGFEMLFGKKREVDFAKWLLDPAWESAMPGVHKMNIYVPNISISYKF
jgi:long-chain fatty acid transport protein